MEANEIDVVHILRDVMDIVCSFLELKDLSSVSKVCKSWRYEALRARTTRFYVQHRRLPYRFEKWESVLDMNPRVSLLFYKRNDFPGEHSAEYEQILTDSLKQLTHRTIAIGLTEYLTTEDVESNTSNMLGSNCDIFQFFFPNIQVFFFFQSLNPNFNQEEVCEAAVNNAVEELGLNEHIKSTIILCQACATYANASYDLTRKLFKRIHETTASSSEIIAFRPTNILSVNCQKENGIIDRPWVVALKIPHGPDVESWTTMIHMTAQIGEIEHKMRELKKKVKPRRHYVGFLCGFWKYVNFTQEFQCQPECSHVGHPACDKQKVMSILKHYFPSVPFVGTFNNSFLRISRRGEPTDYYFAVTTYVTVMILSHN